MVDNMTLIRSLALAFGIILAATVSSALAMKEDIVGAVVKTDQGAALSTNAGEYLPIGKDLSGMIGKTVVVVGNVEDGVLSKTIRPKSIMVLKDKDLVDPLTAANRMNKG